MVVVGGWGGRNRLVMGDSPWSQLLKGGGLFWLNVELEGGDRWDGDQGGADGWQAQQSETI